MNKTEAKKEARLLASKIIENLPYFETTEDEDGNAIKSMFVGTVMQIAPSGKYYTPWACSNVTEKEAEVDDAFFDTLENELSKHNIFLSDSPGDFCDILANQLIEA